MYCGLCGVELVRIEVDKRVHSNVPGNKKNAQLQFRIKNTGRIAASLTLELQECRPSYLAVVTKRSDVEIDPKSNVMVGPKALETITVEADFSGGGVVMARLKWLLSNRLRSFDIVGEFLPESATQKQTK